MAVQKLIYSGEYDIVVVGAGIAASWHLAVQQKLAIG